jgi:hypothetical protein
MPRHMTASWLRLAGARPMRETRLISSSMAPLRSTYSTAGLLCAGWTYQPGPTVTVPVLARPDPIVTLAPVASSCRLATAELSNGQPAVSTAMIATTMKSQRSLNLVVLAAGPRPDSSATTKKLTQAIGAAAKGRDGEGCERDDDDRGSDQPEASRRRRAPDGAAAAAGDQPDWQAEQQYDAPRHRAHLQHGPADRCEGQSRSRPRETRPVGRIDHRWLLVLWRHRSYLVADSRTTMAARVATPPMVAASSLGRTDLGSPCPRRSARWLRIMSAYAVTAMTAPSTMSGTPTT